MSIPEPTTHLVQRENLKESKIGVSPSDTPSTSQTSPKTIPEEPIAPPLTSNLNEFVDSVEDWELRTPIAPPLTSLEEARVISLAGT